MNELTKKLLEKIAVSNPAAPQKSSLPGMEPSSPSTAYLNQGGDQAKAQEAGGVAKTTPAYPGYINVGDKSAPAQTAGDVAGRSGAPDTGDLGMGQDGDRTVTKSAAFEAGILAALGRDD